MTMGKVLRALGLLASLLHAISAMPSFDHGSFNDGSLLTFGSILHPRSEPFEIRGVYGGRKKRYIVEREAPSSCSKECKEKVICLPTLGNIIKDCKCQKCPTGVPALDGKSCQENCAKGTITVRMLMTSPNTTIQEKRRTRMAVVARLARNPSPLGTVVRLRRTTVTTIGRANAQAILFLISVPGQIQPPRTLNAKSMMRKAVQSPKSQQPDLMARRTMPPSR
jgi:hypothetical protein